MNKTLDIPMYQRSDTAENWESKNPTLGKAEFGYDETNKKMKLGDGITPWNDLPWYNKNFNIVNGTAERSLHTIGSPENRQHIFHELDWDPSVDYTEDDIEYTMGEYAFAEGLVTKASGEASHSEGFCSTASGVYSHAEGQTTDASGYAAHAEGFKTIASGAHSHAEGYYTTASGAHSHAEGNVTTASEDYSHAEGESTTAMGTASHAEGYNTTAYGASSHAEGRETTAEGNYSHAEGIGTIASRVCSHTQGSYNIIDTNREYLHIVGNGTSDEDRSNAHTIDKEGNAWYAGDLTLEGDLTIKGAIRGSTPDGVVISSDNSNIVNGEAVGSLRAIEAMKENREYRLGQYKLGPCAFAEGLNTAASGQASHAEGQSTIAFGLCSHAEGSNTTASGNWSHASGLWTIASNSFQYVIGKYNTVNDGLFVIGNGIGTAVDNERNNAFRVTESGETYAMGSYNSTGADYSEYFEWSDGNPDNEIRTGRFVTMTGKKIKLATSIDDYIIGVVTANASIVGNSYEDSWNGRFMTDVYGNLLYEDKTDDEGNVTTWFKQNPDYDPSQKYIPRSQRPEWSTVGMLGQLVVDDDGTCEVDGYCKPNNNGIATKADSGYRVIDRIDDTHILIIFK